MTEQQVNIELEKMRDQREQWQVEYTKQANQWQHDHDQREKHWFWQRGSWFIAAGIAIGALIVKAFG